MAISYGHNSKLLKKSAILISTSEERRSNAKLRYPPVEGDSLSRFAKPSHAQVAHIPRVLETYTGNRICTNVSVYVFFPF